MTETSERAQVLRARDFRGWEVRDPSGDKVGTVSELLLDPEAGVRFLDVDFGLLRGHALVPAGEVEWVEGAVLLRRWSREVVKRLPPYQTDRPLTAAVLGEMARAYPRAYGDAVDAPPPPDGEGRVVPLGEAKDFKLESGATNPRGWNVFGSDGERAGVVAQLLVDPAALKVRYLEVDVAEDLVLLRDDRRVLIPIEKAELKERGGDVLVERLTAAQIARLPAYTGGAADPLVEQRVHAEFA